LNWLRDLYESNPTAQAIGLISLVCMAGMLLGTVKVRGIGLGTAGVLFAGILVGAISEPIQARTLDFVKELGLVIFVFTIGLQLGPGFFASLRGTGAYLNLLATAIVVLGALLAAVLGMAMGFDPAASLGVFSGATTNTPSLGAAQHALSALPGVTEERAALPALAYAVTYPVAIVVMIATMLLLKRIFRVDPRREARRLEAEQRNSVPIERRTIVVDNDRAEGVHVEAVGGLAACDVVISRVRRASEAESRVAVDGLVLHRGDAVLAVGTASDLDRCEHLLGRVSAEDLTQAPGPVTHRRILVTRWDALGKTLGELGPRRLHGVVVTRITRADLEMTAVPGLRLQFGDVVDVVGEEDRIRKSAEVLGNSLKALNETHFVPVFAGIVLGIGLGTLPIPIPGLPQPLRLGLAGGSLIVAILLGRLGRIGPLVLYAPQSANVAFREFGIALFFACVGLLAGPRFLQVVCSERGLLLMAVGACVTAVPLLLAGAAAIAVQKLDFATVSGLLSGSMTDPPALAFATGLCSSDAPMNAYAAVYPLTTLLRILAAEVLTVTLCGGGNP
jgi:putative transport protein